jgi:hypothetical protein
MVPAAADSLGRITTFTTLEVPSATATFAYNANQILPIAPSPGNKLVIDTVSDATGKVLTTVLRMVPTGLISTITAGATKVASKIGTISGGMTALYYPDKYDASGVVSVWTPLTGLTNTATTFTYAGKVYPMSVDGKPLVLVPAVGTTPASIRIGSVSTPTKLVNGVPMYAASTAPLQTSTAKSEHLTMMLPVKNWRGVQTSF